MSHKPSVNLSLIQKPSHILCSKAISDSSQTLDTKLSLHLFDTRIHDWINDTCQVSLYPFHELESLWWVELHWVAVEEIWHDDEVAICCVLVCDELSVYKFVADHVCEEEDGVGG